MQFQKLRLSGFKSFVETTEFRIEPGLTGVLGPNGCGKSNLLEALRWVMGAASAKAMRAGGMDDVIFSGSGARPSRNHAEVALTVDNADRTAPAPFTDDAVLEVVRRIDRGAGSSYRINGREARARDVQLLFADASTGANSPALVRQGQISELIAAKPQNRRMILEEAGGVSGLHTRRHEAELRLRAAESNIERLDDVAGELATALGRLKREARQAERYRRLSAQIRALQGALFFARWRDAAAVAAQGEAEAARALQGAETSARAAAAAAAARLAADEALPPLREEAQVAAAVLGRLAIETDRLEREAEQASAEVRRRRAAMDRLAADQGREGQAFDDAAAALARLGPELAQVEAEAAAAPERLPRLEAAWQAADAARAQAEGAGEAIAARLAARQANRHAAELRVAEAQSRLARAQRALDAAKADRGALASQADPRAGEAQGRLDAALAALGDARAAQGEAETAQATATAREARARDRARASEDRLARLATEARGLAQLAAATAPGGFACALEQVIPQAGLETALAAALGDDLNAALDARAPAFWAGRDAVGPAWPQGVWPRAPSRWRSLIAAPAQLAARLAFTALVDRADGDRLARDLPPGARLVSREGDLWRWDGLVSRAEAPRPAAVRLEQRRRLAEIEAEIDRLAPAGAAAVQDHQAAAASLRVAQETLRAARPGLEAAERALAAARDQAERLGRETARRDARAQSLDETVARFDAERDEAEAVLAGARKDAEGLAVADDDGEDLGLAQARAGAAAAREAAAAARAALDLEVRERAGRDRRLGVRRDHADWTRRGQAAAARLEALRAERAQAQGALAAADAAPARVEARRLVLLDQLSLGQARQAKAADVLAEADAARAVADRVAHAADAEAAQARERRAALVARWEAARERLVEIDAALREATHLEPEALGRALADDAVAIPGDAAGVEQHLAALEGERDTIGPVNLRADEEAVAYEGRLGALQAERADLTGAVARLRQGIEALNGEGRERLLGAFEVINGHFQTLFQALFGGGQAELRLVESDDPLEAGLEIFACPPGKRLAVMSLMSGGEQALTAAALIFGVFLANPAPICVLDEVDAPLDDANVERFCDLLNEMRRRTQTRFVAITHNPVTMARMDRLYGVTMPERGVSQLVSVDLREAAAMVA